MTVSKCTAKLIVVLEWALYFIVVSIMLTGLLLLYIRPGSPDGEDKDILLVKIKLGLITAAWFIIGAFLCAFLTTAVLQENSSLCKAWCVINILLILIVLAIDMILQCIGFNGVSLIILIVSVIQRFYSISVIWDFSNVLVNEKYDAKISFCE